MIPYLELEEELEDFQETPQAPIQDIWGTKNSQAIHTSQQTNAAISNQGELVKLPSNKVMLESEFKIFDSIMKSLPKPRLSVSLIPPNIQVSPVIPTGIAQPPTTQNNSFEFQLNQKGIIVLALVFSGFFLSTLALIRVWGTTDIAQQQAYQERIDNQYNEIGKRYDKLAKVTEKLGKKSDICVSFYCGGNNGRVGASDDTQEPPSQPANTKSSHINYGNINFEELPPENISNQDYYDALVEVTRWKKSGNSKSKASAFVTWIRENPRTAKSEGYPSYSAISKAFSEIYQ